MSFDMNKKLNIEKQKFPQLPELENIEGQITSVIVRPKKFKGQQAYVQDQEGNFILDINGEKIPKYEFSLTINLKKFSLNDGSARKQWFAVGTSAHPKSNLTKLLSNLKINLPNPTGISVVNALTNLDIKFQLKNNPNHNEPDHPWQNIILDTVRSASKPKEQVISPTEIEPILWEEEQ